MYIAPICFEDVRHWFLNVDKKFDYLCMFLSGNGDYNEVINREILDNSYLIDRTTGDSICYFFCSSFRVEESDGLLDFNKWNVRSRNIYEMLKDDRITSFSQSELLREDVCDYYRKEIRRSLLPALVFIDKKEKVFLYPIKSYKDIRALLTPLGILNDYLRDTKEIEFQLREARRKKEKVDLENKRLEELNRAIENAQEKSEQAKGLVDRIVEICRRYNFDNVTLNKMSKYPEKIRQIVSLFQINDSELSEKLFLLKKTISQFKIVKKGKISYIQNEIDNIQRKEYVDWEGRIGELKEELNRCRVECICNLKELNLNLDIDVFIEEFEKRRFGIQLISLLETSRLKQNIDVVTVNDNKTLVLKCFVAGAKALERERDAIISGVNDQNIEKKYTNTSVECYTFKNFESRFVEGGPQILYNKFIEEEADIVVFVLDEVVGGITRQEFDVAVKAIKQNNYKKPTIFVFSNKENEGGVENKEILEIRKIMNDIKQYWIDYSSLEVLKLQMQLKLDKLYKK